jgi:hypothetical protein
MVATKRPHERLTSTPKPGLSSPIRSLITTSRADRAPAPSIAWPLVNGMSGILALPSFVARTMPADRSPRRAGSPPKMKLTSQPLPVSLKPANSASNHGRKAEMKRSRPAPAMIRSVRESLLRSTGAPSTGRCGGRRER